MPEDGGVGNTDFNAGKQLSKFGYEIQKLWCLSSLIPLHLAKARNYLKMPPQKDNYAPPNMLDDCSLSQQTLLLNRVLKAAGKRPLTEPDSHDIHQHVKMTY